MTIIDRDKGAKAMIERLRNSVIVRAGLVGDLAEATHGSSGLSVQEIGAIHEFGIGVPERSFIRSVADDENQTSAARKVAQKLYRGVAPQKAGTSEGKRLAAAMKAKINSGLTPALKKETIQRKGHAKAIYETGKVYRAIGYEVEVRK